MTITAANRGDATATSVFIQFFEHDGLEEVQSITCPPGFTTDSVPRRRACAQGVMGPEAAATMVVRIRFIAQGPDAGSGQPLSIEHWAEVGAVGVVDPTPGDTAATETVRVAFDASHALRASWSALPLPM